MIDEKLARRPGLCPCKREAIELADGQRYYFPPAGEILARGGEAAAALLRMVRDVRRGDDPDRLALGLAAAAALARHLLRDGYTLDEGQLRELVPFDPMSWSPPPSDAELRGLLPLLGRVERYLEPALAALEAAEGVAP